MGDDKYLTIIAQLQSAEFDKAAEAMGRRLQTLKDGTQKYESAAQTANRILKEHADALNVVSGAAAKKISFTKKMADAFTIAGAKLITMTLGIRALARYMREGVQAIIEHNAALKAQQAEVGKEFDNLAVIMGEKFGPAISTVLEGMANAVRGISNAIDPVVQLQQDIDALKATMQESAAVTVDTTDYTNQLNQSVMQSVGFIQAQTDAINENNYTKSRGVKLQEMELRLAALLAEREKNKVKKAIKPDMKEDPMIAIENKRRQTEREGIAATLKANFEKQKKLAEMEKDAALESKERRWEILDAQIEASNEELKIKAATAAAAKDATLQGMGATAAGLANIWAASEKNEKKRAEKTRVIALGQSIIQTYLAASKAFAEFGGFPFGVGPMLASIAQGAVNTGVIASQKFASGTRFAPGGMSLVGENGPEVLNIPRGSRVYNNSETRNMNMGGIVVNVNGNATPETVQGLRMAAKDITRALEQAARNGFLNKARLGLA